MNILKEGVIEMKTAEKKALRNLKLQELYDYNEQTGGRDVQLRFDDLSTNEKDKQEHLACEYLNDKGLIYYKILGRNYYQAKITSNGIDVIENGN
jgi:hypothetical protein